MNKTLLKNIGIYAAIIALFVIIAYGFTPQVLSGKVVNQSDISGWQGMARETSVWNSAHPDNKTAWSGTMFGGMPNVTFFDNFEGDWTNPIYKALLCGRRPASYLFIALLGAFLMMLSMGMNRYIAIVGAFAVAFCSYNMQIIQVGHNTKMQAIAFAPWAIAGIVYAYRKALGDKDAPWRKWLPQSIAAAVLFSLALSFQIKANHVQITWYLAVIIFIYAIATLVWVLRKENHSLLGRFAAVSALLLAVGVVGIGTNANKLIPTAEYAPYTMRGGSELSTDGANDRGLSLDYATAWSYGIEETPNLLIPNFNGGSSSGSLSENSATWQLFEKANANPSQVCQALPLYWGPQPFTAGPMYIGAISIFLFVLGLCLVRGREKWFALACCLVAVLLSWGNHFMPFTRFFFEYVPMYSKFRTVSMALVILQFCVPLLGFYVLDRIFRDEYPGREVVRATWISMGITALFCLVCALIPSIAGDFVAASDSQMQDIVSKALQSDRRTLLQADAWRSFLFIVACAGAIMWCYLKPGVAPKRYDIALCIIAVLVFADLWGVGKRYLNADDFVTVRNFSKTMNERPVDKMILQDTTPSYRVLDLSENTFNSSLTSYRHKSIGGYSPTKMQRYQDLIDHYISGEISAFASSAKNAKTVSDIQENVPYMPVISMLNGKYVIVDGECPPVVNPYAYGNAWFVRDWKTVDSADEEIAALGEVDLHCTAVVRSADTPDCLGGETSEGSFITLESYAPNEMHYSYRCTGRSVAVFSEIWHPSWKATVDGQPLKLFRADWVLRGAVIPEGCGEIVMKYEPQDYARGRAVSAACSILLLLLCCGVVAMKIIRR